MIAFGVFDLEWMMHMPRNPIGKREDGTFVTVKMMTEKDRGKKCNLKCPNPKCNGKFQFVLGNEDSNFEPYFRHDGKEPCNANAAFMAGLYGCLEEYIRTQGKFVLPAVIIHFPRQGEINDGSIKFMSKVVEDNDIELFPEKEVSFDDIRVQYNGDKPVSLLGSIKGKWLTFVIEDIDIGCVKKNKIGDKKYCYDDATIVVDIQTILPENIDDLDISMLLEQLRSHQQVFQWLYTPKWKDHLERIRKKQQQLVEKEKKTTYSNKEYVKPKQISEEVSNDEKKRQIYENKKPLIILGHADIPITWRICEMCGSVISHFRTTDGLEGTNAPYLCVCHDCAQKNKEK